MDDSSGSSRRRILTLTGIGLGTALAGCTSAPGTVPDAGEATITVRLRNRDDVQREYEVVARQGDAVTDSFSGVLPPDATQPVEMVATFRLTDAQYEFTINTSGGQRGRTWDPGACSDFLVDAFIEDGEPGFDAECRTE